MSEKYEDCVIKRNGTKEPVSFVKSGEPDPK